MAAILEDDISNRSLFNEKLRILIEILLTLVTQGPIDSRRQAIIWK